MRGHRVIDVIYGDPVIMCPNCSQQVTVQLGGISYHTMVATGDACPAIGKSVRLLSAEVIVVSPDE